MLRFSSPQEARGPPCSTTPRSDARWHLSIDGGFMEPQARSQVGGEETGHIGRGQLAAEPARVAFRRACQGLTLLLACAAQPHEKQSADSK